MSNVDDVKCEICKKYNRQDALAYRDMKRRLKGVFVTLEEEQIMGQLLWSYAKDMIQNRVPELKDEQ